MVQVDNKMYERYWYLSQHLFDLTEEEDKEFVRLSKLINLDF